MNDVYSTARESTECSWLHSEMENLFSDGLTSDQRVRANRHIAECAECRAEVDSLRAIDPLMRNVLRYRAAIAATPVRRRIHVGRSLGLAAALAGIAALTLVLWNPLQPSMPGPSIAQSPGTEDVAPIDPKGTAPAEIDLTKPDVELGKPDNTPLTPLEPSPSPEGAGGVQAQAAGFAVIDRVGREWTLSDFRGQTVLVGVLSPKQPQAAANLERIYRSLGTKLRLLAVAGNRKEPAPRDTTFQLLYNNGSHLLGAKAAEYLVLDGKGTVVSRGSLLGDSAAIVNAVSATLKSLDGR